MELQFKKSEERADMIQELSLILHLKATFGSFNDNIFAYYLDLGKLDDLDYEFTFIADDFLIKEMTVQELLDLKNVSYFCSKIYSEKYHEIKGSRVFTINS
tara:strand:+ start:56 stop:358 length:303 start_codon:yes stop_codon:yes gene_type:complete